MSGQIVLTIVSFASDIFDLFLSIFFFDIFLDRIKKIKYRYILILIFLFILKEIFFIQSRATVWNTLNFVLVNLFIIFFFYKGKVFLKLFLTVLYIVLDVLTEAVVGFTLLNIHHLGMQSIETSFIMQFEGTVISKLLQLLIVRIVSKYKRKSGELSPRYGLLLLVVPLISILIVYTYVFNAYKILNSYEGTVILILAVLGIFYFNLVIFEFFDCQMRQSEMRQRYALAEHQLQDQIHHYKKLINSREEIYSVLHDVKNHLISIKALAEKKNPDEIHHYIDSLNIQKLDKNRTIDTGHPFLDSVLEEKKKLAQENDIQFDYKVQLPDIPNINNTDLCVVLGYAFDFAIQLCRPSRNIKRIEARIGYKNHFFVVSVKSLFDTQEGAFGSLKNRQAELAMDSMHKEVEKYNGNIQCISDNSQWVIHIYMKDHL